MKMIIVDFDIAARLIKLTEREVKLQENIEAQRGNGQTPQEATHNLNYEASSSEDEGAGFLIEDLEGSTYATSTLSRKYSK
jgi:hypothetical protein